MKTTWKFVLPLLLSISAIAYADVVLNSPISPASSALHQATAINFDTLDLNPEKYAAFVEDLTEAHVAIVSVFGLVCDFCARGIEKTFGKDKSVKKIDVDLDNGKILIAYDFDTDVDVNEVKEKIIANGQDVIALHVVETRQ